MPEPLYDVVIKGVQSAEPVENIIKQIAELLHNHSKAFEFQLSEALIFNQNHTSVRESVPKREAEILQQQLQHLGVIAELQAALQLTPKEEDKPDNGMHTCPACGHVQPKAADGIDTCEVCGIVGSKFQGYRKRKHILESEKRRLTLSEQLEARRMREQAEFSEEEQMRIQARKQLGLKKSWLTSPAYISALVLVIAIAGGIFLYPYLPFAQSEDETEIALAQEGGSVEQAKGLVLNMPEGSGGGIAVNFAEETNAGTAATGEIANTLGDQGSNRTDAALNTAAERVNNATDETENLTGVNPNKILKNLAIALKTGDETTQDDELQKLLDVSHQKLASKVFDEGAQQSRPNISIKAFAEHLRAQGIPYPFHRQEAEKVITQNAKTDNIEQSVNKTAENLQQFEHYLQSGQYKRIEDLIRSEQQPYAKALFASELIWVRKQQERLDEAHHWLDKISALYSPKAAAREQALLLGLQAKAYAYLGNHKQAASKIQDSIAQAEKMTDESGHTPLFCQLVGDQVQANQTQAAEHFLKKAFEHVDHTYEDFLTQSESYANIALGFAFIVDFKEAKFVLSFVKDAFLYEETKKNIGLVAQELNAFIDKKHEPKAIKPVELLNKAKLNKDEKYQNAILSDF